MTLFQFHGRMRGIVLVVFVVGRTLSYTDLACHNSDYKKSKKL